MHIFSWDTHACSHTWKEDRLHIVEGENPDPVRNCMTHTAFHWTCLAIQCALWSPHSVFWKIQIVFILQGATRDPGPQRPRIIPLAWASLGCGLNICMCTVVSQKLIIYVECTTRLRQESQARACCQPQGSVRRWRSRQLIYQWFKISKRNGAAEM